MYIKRLDEMMGAPAQYDAQVAGNLFGALMGSVVKAWEFHLLTGSYAEHDALDTYYHDIIGHTDDLIEHYIASHGKEGLAFGNVQLDTTSAVSYFESLKCVVCQYRDGLFADDSIAVSDIDDILGLIESTLYKLTNLS